MKLVHDVFSVVYCVVNTRTNTRVSQFYTRAFDAKRKAKQMRHGINTHYKAMQFCLVNGIDLEWEGQ